jgi:hypothetical protein
MTSKLVLRDVDQFMADYVPVYQPLYPLFLGKSQSYAEEVGKLTFKRLEAVGDIRQKHILPKDTEIRQIAAVESSKSFKKYFLANQYVQSSLQDQGQNEDVIRQVLDEHQKQMDDLFLLGEGTSASTMINNGLFWSNDPFYEVESSVELDTDQDVAISLHQAVMANASDANQVAGRKALIYYGANVVPLFNGLFAASSQSVKSVLGSSLGPSYSIVEMPQAVTPASSHGWLIANLDQVKLHYTSLPQLKDQGVNAEKMYSWHNFLMGSCMLEVLADQAVIKQPVTIEA